MPRSGLSLAAPAGLVLLGLLLLPPLQDVGTQLRSETEALVSQPGSLQRRNTNAFARILGELRIGAADFLFVKTELYLHGGIGYAAHTDDLDESQEALAGEAHSLMGEEGLPMPGDHEPPDPAGHSEDHAGHAHEHGHVESHGEGEAVPTTMRGAEDDFRGIVGDLERAIKPWRSPDSPHILVGGAELLPWFRLMTITNPHFVRGYRVGAMWLGRERQYDEALAFLQEGIDGNAGNPELFLLYLSKVLMLMHKDRLGGESCLEEGLMAAREGVRLGIAVRPENGEVGKIHAGLLWNADHAEDLLFLMRFEAMILERLGRRAEALEALETSRRLYPDDYPLQRIQERLLQG